MNTLKKILHVRRNPGKHWVGDGFPVRSIFTYDNVARDVSPFLLMDYAGPAHFDPTTERRGVGEHPHRGFETVSIVYDGEVEHRDSGGGGGKIGPGDVQWMTAASGLVHEEFHGREFAARGGRFEMVQLWVNLPKKDKKSPPSYQGILASQIPEVELPEGAGKVRVIAGEWDGKAGPARTFTRMNVWDVRMKNGHSFSVSVSEGDSAAVFVLSGRVRIGDEQIGESEFVIFEHAGDRVELTATEDSKILFLSGEPIPEPIVGYGPFVMNTPDEIRQAFVDYQEGRMGQLVASSR